MSEADCRRQRARAGRRSIVLAVSLLVAFGEASAQVQQQGGPVVIDSVRVEGNVRLGSSVILEMFPIKPGDEVTILQVREATKALMASGQFRDVVIRALGGTAPTGTLVLEVDERPMVRDVRIVGLRNADVGAVRDSAGLANNAPYAPHRVELAKAVILDELGRKGIPFASIDDRLAPVPDQDGVVDLVIEVEEGNRVTVAGFEVAGNDALDDGTVLGAMTVRPEGFWWFQPGTYERTLYEQDLAVNIPSVYYDRGYLDLEVVADTLVIDPQTGKARIQIQVDEGWQYRVARFTIEGNSALTDEELEPFFREEQGGLLASLGIGGAEGEAQQRGEVFNQSRLQEGLRGVQDAYSNRGYLWAEVAPAVEKTEIGGEPAVEVTVLVRENQLATIDEIHIRGNDFTHDWVIREKILLLPGDTYSLQRILASYQNIQSLGFFEAPMPPPDIRQDRENGEVDVTFTVKEQQTGNINFGSSIGGGVGVAGFVAYEQPNLFGQAKLGDVRWDFGRFVNSFTLRYSDPALFRSRISGTISLFNTRDRFIRFNTGNRRRIGGGLRFGFPLPNDPRARFFVGYSLSRTKFNLRSGATDTSLFGIDDGVQSQLSLGILRSTLNHPIFPTQGAEQRIDTEFNGGFLGGSGTFQKVTGRMRWWVPIGQLGGGAATPSSAILTAGLDVRGGALFGDPSRFPFERFWMGGVQFGEQLRGYDETSVTPFGFFPEGSQGIRDVDRLGNAFTALTAEMAMNLGPAFRFSTFFDAGNVWTRPGEIDPTRLFKGAGFGLTLQSPFGPLGIDYAYGFDKDVPGWQLHFQFGQGGL